MRILIIEDEPGMAMGLEDNLQFEGYETLIAWDNREGLDLALRGQPDLILLDIMLPYEDELEVCRELRSRNIAVPIIILALRGEESDKALALDAGADDYITKPFSLREFLARVRAILRRYYPKELT